MAIPKVMGTEVEYGITVKGDPDFDPISSCVLLVNAYREDHAGEILWDYDQENPLADARGFQVDGEKYTPNQQENIARNKTLVNGARYYVDHAHPEYSCPEVTNVRDLVVHEKAGERILEVSRREANALLPAGTQMLIYKNNSDRKGNSYGSHENYLMDRRTSFKQIVECLMPFFVTRQVYCGAGKVGSENRGHPCDYQISQRADFFETEVALDTMVKRPIINTRDEPHADREKYRRLHVIVGDANLSEYTIYLRNGATAIVLAMIEDGAITKNLSLRDPVRAIKEVSHDSTLQARVPARRRQAPQRGRDPGRVPRDGARLHREAVARPDHEGRAGEVGARDRRPAARSDGALREDRLGDEEGDDRAVHGAQVAGLELAPGGDARPPVPRPSSGEGSVLSSRETGSRRANRRRRRDPRGGPHTAGRHAGVFPRGVSQEVRSGGIRGQLGLDLVRRRQRADQAHPDGRAAQGNEGPRGRTAREFPTAADLVRNLRA